MTCVGFTEGHTRQETVVPIVSQPLFDTTEFTGVENPKY